jgi:hypothetical protein
VILLPTVAFDFADRHRFERRAVQGVDDLLGQVGFDDGDDLFHGVPSPSFSITIDDGTGSTSLC